MISMARAEITPPKFEPVTLAFVYFIGRLAARTKLKFWNIPVKRKRHFWVGKPPSKCIKILSFAFKRKNQFLPPAAVMIKANSISG